MFETLRRQRRKHGLRVHLQRAATRKLDQLLYRVDRGSMSRAFRAVGLSEGAVVCVHSALSKLGYVAGGGDAVIDAIIDVIGPSGTLLMPAFSTGGAMAEYIESGEPIDLRHAPSRVGAVTELFRQRQGVARSAHPTNSLTAWGKEATAFLAGHEQSLTAYGHDTPYGRLAARDDTFILMLETHVHSLLHHLQERVEFPHLFLPRTASVRFVDAHGTEHSMTTRLMRPRTPYFIAVPAAARDEPQWAILHDFALIFPRHREDELRQRGVHFAGYPQLHSRRMTLESEGVLRAARLGKGEVGLLHVRGFLQRVEPELKNLLEHFRSSYVPENLTGLEYF